MPTDLRAGTALAGLTLVAALAAVPLQAQDALNRVTPKTQVRSVEFRFEDGPSLDEDQLRQKIALSGQGSLVGLRRTFGFIPFVPPVGAHPFDPTEMARDVVRLRRFYQQSGFPRAEVDYQAKYQAKPDVIEVTYLIDEGPPLAVDSLTFEGIEAPLRVPARAARSWRRFTRGEQQRVERAGRDEKRSLADSTVRWFRAHGYPFAMARTVARVDSAANRASLTVQVDPGPRSRIRRIEVTGNRTIPQREIVRQLPVRPGDWYDARAIEQAREQLTQMDIVRLASVAVPRDSARDSSVVLVLGMTENPEHIIKGEAGYISSGGLTSQAAWTDRSWLGGLRTFTVAATAQSGLAALENPAQQLYRLSLTAFQPYVGDRRISVAGGPFAEYRNDIRDRSLAVGFEGSLVWAPAPLRSLSLGYAIEHRRVYDYGFGADLPPEEYLPLLNLSDAAGAGTLAQTRNTSALTLEGSYGRLDRIANPRKGYVIRPRIATTLPGFNTSEYTLLDLGATAYLPVSKTLGFTFRAGAGRIYPRGNSLDAVGSESPFVSLLRLRDVSFTAGGTRDVRGWGSLLVGPKIPQVELQREGDSTVAVANRYTPVGGLARLVGSVEFHFPMPIGGDALQPYLFYDGGRIWIPDRRFALNARVIDEDKYYHAVGVGLGYQTVVGAIQVAVGYKLNPSPLDLRSPQDVLDALKAGAPIESAATSSSRRFHLHFSIGATF
ncbi:MAG TPA: BamA/TamA family outer membrane protein [Gemmatimonadales bacterium]|nr:BamA/TamA family outer membrane protein [Gemmatimonadales bacterium]